MTKNLQKNETLSHMIEMSDKERLLEMILNHIGGVTFIDKDGRYVYVNQTFTDITGYTFEELKDRPVTDFFPNSPIDKVLATGKHIFAMPYRIFTKNNETIQLLSSYYPVCENGYIRGCVFLIYLRNMEQMIELNTNIQELMSEIFDAQGSQMVISKERHSVDNIVGNSEAIKNMKKDILRAARTKSTVLIEGETGSGKELVASALHYHSMRAEGPFIKVNCAAIPRELMEAEFFGYEGGAFTGAAKHGKKGKFEMANGGTLFLDEINQLSFELQPKLLRAIQEREIVPVGGSRSIPVDCRIIAATNVGLEQMVEKGKFRQDLYYRLNVVNVHVPPLRERKEDIPLLADYLMQRSNKQMGMQVPNISATAKERLKSYAWPGNVRELQNVVERAMNMAWGETITWRHLKPYFDIVMLKENEAESSDLSIRKRKRNLELESIKEALELSGGNKTQAAEILQISRSMLYKKLNKYKL